MSESLALRDGLFNKEGLRVTRNTQGLSGFISVEFLVWFEISLTPCPNGDPGSCPVRRLPLTGLQPLISEFPAISVQICRGDGVTSWKVDLSDADTSLASDRVEQVYASLFFIDGWIAELVDRFVN